MVEDLETHFTTNFGGRKVSAIETSGQFDLDFLKYICEQQPYYLAGLCLAVKDAEISEEFRLLFRVYG